jgi:hypothetical protein
VTISQPDLTSRPSLDAASVLERLPIDLYQKHLGQPAALGAADSPSGEPASARVAELIADAFAWYRRFGTPWARRTIVAVEEIDRGGVRIAGGGTLSSARLAAGFHEARVGHAVVIGASAGAEVDLEVERRWKESRPDEAMFLSALAVAVAEHLRGETELAAAEEAARQGASALPRFAPGYRGWEVSDLPRLLELLRERGPLDALPSGGLRPMKSTVVLVGWTPRQDLGPLDGFWDREFASRTPEDDSKEASYAVPERALEKWARTRLVIRGADGGRVRATFRFDGKTCASLSRPLAVDYELEVERGEDGCMKIVAGSCAPAPGDTGVRWTCACREGPQAFHAALREPPPLVGERLDAALRWRPDESPSACLCTAAQRNHKWLLALHTLHFALRRGAWPGDAHATP